MIGLMSSVYGSSVLKTNKIRIKANFRAIGVIFCLDGVADFVVSSMNESARY